MREEQKGRKGLRLLAGPRARAVVEGRDLALTTDFRAVFGEIVRSHLEAVDPSSVFPGFSALSEPLGLFG